MIDQQLVERALRVGGHRVRIAAAMTARMACREHAGRGRYGVIRTATDGLVSVTTESNSAQAKCTSVPTGMP